LISSEQPLALEIFLFLQTLDAPSQYTQASTEEDVRDAPPYALHWIVSASLIIFLLTGISCFRRRLLQVLLSGMLCHVSSVWQTSAGFADLP
jgi:hypothetical protein